MNDLRLRWLVMQRAEAARYASDVSCAHLQEADRLAAYDRALRWEAAAAAAAGDWGAVKRIVEEVES